MERNDNRRLDIYPVKIKSIQKGTHGSEDKGKCDAE